MPSGKNGTYSISLHFRLRVLGAMSVYCALLGESLRLQKIIDAVRVAVHVGQHPSYVAPIVFVFRAKHNGFTDVFFVTHPFIQESFSFWHMPRSLFAIGVFPDTFRPY